MPRYLFEQSPSKGTPTDSQDPIRRDADLRRSAQRSKITTMITPPAQEKPKSTTPLPLKK